MQGFEFSAKPVITISGKEYECDPTNLDLIHGIMQDFPQIMGIAVEIEQAQKMHQDALKKQDAKGLQEANEKIYGLNLRLIDHCRGFIFGAIGEKEYQEIFAGKRPNSIDHLNLCQYIFSFIMEGRENVIKEYLDPPTVTNHAV